VGQLRSFTRHAAGEVDRLVPAIALRGWRLRRGLQLACAGAHRQKPRACAAGRIFSRAKARRRDSCCCPHLEKVTREYLRQLDAAAEGDAVAAAKHEWVTLELIDQMTRAFSGGFMGRFWVSRPLPVRDYIVERLGNEAKVWLDRFDEDFAVGKYQPIPPEAIYLAPPVELEAELAFRRTGENHRWMYDRVSLGDLLRTVGFVRPVACEAAQSAIPRFATYGLDTEADGRVRKPDSLFMEANRPEK